jgi:alkylhydroperoxidase family enzyme
MSWNIFKKHSLAAVKPVATPGDRTSRRREALGKIREVLAQSSAFATPQDVTRFSKINPASFTDQRVNELYEEIRKVFHDHKAKN